MRHILAPHMKLRVYVILRGGLGNQLHQIAAALSLAERLNGSIRIFAKIVDTANNPSRRGYFKSLDLDNLFPGASICLVNKIEYLLFSFLNKMAWPLGGKYLINEANFSHLPFRRGPYILKGYFQESRFLPEIIEPANLFPHSGILNESINVHIRLTDFVAIDKNPLEHSYFTNGIGYFLSRNQEANIRVFSDDIPTARQMLSNVHRITFPEETSELSPPDLLKELSSSKFLVASRSSLWYWAAQIVKSRGGEVIGPWPDNLQMHNWIRL